MHCCWCLHDEVCEGVAMGTACDEQLVPVTAVSGRAQETVAAERLMPSPVRCIHEAIDAVPHGGSVPDGSFHVLRRSASATKYATTTTAICAQRKHRSDTRFEWGQETEEKQDLIKVVFPQRGRAIAAKNTEFTRTEKLQKSIVRSGSAGGSSNASSRTCPGSCRTAGRLSG